MPKQRSILWIQQADRPALWNVLEIYSGKKHRLATLQSPHCQLAKNPLKSVTLTNQGGVSIFTHPGDLKHTVRGVHGGQKRPGCVLVQI